MEHDGYRLILFGGGPSLLRLAEHYAPVRDVVVVSCPRRAALAIDGTPWTERIRNTGAELHVVEKLDSDLVRRLHGGRAVGLSFGASWIFKPEVITLFQGLFFNNHNTDLPRNRGGGGLSWMIMNGDRQGTVLLHRVAPGLDEGDIVLRHPLTYPEDCDTPARMYAFLEDACHEAIVPFLDGVFQGKPVPGTPQDQSRATYFPRLDGAVHAYIDWSWSGPEILRFVQAFDDPYPGGRTLWNGQTVLLRGCSLAPDLESFHPFQSGLIYRIHGNSLYVCARERSLAFSEVRSEEGENLLASIRLGDRLHTPRPLLDQALSTRARWNSLGSAPGDK